MHSEMLYISLELLDLEKKPKTDSESPGKALSYEPLTVQIHCNSKVPCAMHVLV